MADDQFDALCDGPLAPALAGLETARKQAVQRFWMIMGAGVVVAVAAIVLTRFGVLGWVIAIFALLGGWIFASMPMSRAARTLKDPTLQAIGAAQGFTHTPDGFIADGYEPLHPLLGRPNSRQFRDRFHGEHEGQPFVFYEATLVSGSGKSRREVFNGLIYSLKRRPVQGETVIVPDRGLFNWVKPGSGMERVRFEDDEAFEKKFEVYSTRPDEARGLINPVVRQQLAAWRETHGKILVRIAGEDITAAFAGKGDRFEPGSMMKATPGRERVRAMWHDLEAAIAHLRQVRQTLG